MYDDCKFVAALCSNPPCFSEKHFSPLKNMSGLILCDHSRKDFHWWDAMGKANRTPICYLLKREPEFLLTEQMDLSCMRRGQKHSHFQCPRHCSPSLDRWIKTSETVQMFPPPQSLG